MVSARDVLARSRTYSSLGALIMAIIGGLYLAVFEFGIELANAVTGIVTDPLAVIGPGAANIMSAILNGGAGIIWFAARATQAQFLPGTPWAATPLAFAFGILSVGLGFLALNWVLQRPGTSDFALGTSVDLDDIVPFDVGVTEDDEN